MTEPPLATQPSLGESVGGATVGLSFVGSTEQSANIPVIARDRSDRLGRELCLGPKDASQLSPRVQVVQTLLCDTHGDKLGSLLLDDPATNRFDLSNAVADLVNFVDRAESALRSLGVESVAINADDAPNTVPTVTSPTITVMGGFSVTAADGSIPHWTSRKARALLQILVAARGQPLSREHIMEALWPGEAPANLSNRMSVAISTVRRALDPTRLHAAHHFLRAERNLLQLSRDRLDIDVENFLRAATEAIVHQESTHDDELTYAIDLYTGDVFADEPDADWADQLRREAHTAFVAMCRRHAEAASAQDDALLAAELHRRVLTVDRYDEDAHLGLIAALESLGVVAQARAAKEHYISTMSELAS